jgi:hypothetical protein
VAAIAFETCETFDPAVRNPTSGATGLIQFMDETARGLGTTTDALASLSAEAQLAYVEAHFRPYRGHLADIGDVYMTILWPGAVGKPLDFPLFVRGTIEYAQNSVLDLDGDGAITKQEAVSQVVAAKPREERPECAHISSMLVGGESMR